jgi:hypothetical protein
MASNIHYDEQYNMFWYHDEPGKTTAVVMNATEINAGVDYVKWAWEQLGDATAINGDPLPYKRKEDPDGI